MLKKGLNLVFLAGLLLHGLPVLAITPPPKPGQPVAAAKGVVSWDTLVTGVTFDPMAEKLKPTFKPAVQVLNKKPVKLQGFMIPLDQKRDQTKYILSAVAPSCPFCLPGGPESMVEIRHKKGSSTRITFEALTVKGTFVLVSNIEEGVFYRLLDAEVVK